MDEECDFNSPIGQIIKEINALCKKPKLDEQLGSALDLFNAKISQQEKFMNNGIFRINFAEAALFLQSCADLYGKKVDLLWDQLLEFHTRLIEYDCAHEKEKGKKLNEDVIKQLEERRNRYKRKKKFKLVLAQDDNLEEFLFDKPIAEDKRSKEKRNTFDSDENLHRAWKNLELKSTKLKSIPNAIYKQQLTMYRMKNYYIMKSQDFDILDEEDGEFNTKYSRIPGWHHIEHLFEYNTKGLLPDKNNLIATLRLGAYLRVKFLRDKKIPFGAPYSEYKEEYLAFKEKFFESEAKKWQNMPLDSLEDLHKQLAYLSQKEREVYNKTTSKNPETLPWIPSKPSSVSDCSENSKESAITVCDSLEKMIDECDDDSLFELSIGGPADISNSDLFVRLEKLSTDIINTKFRQDSGFFDSESECENDQSKDNRLEGPGQSLGTVEGETNPSLCENNLNPSEVNLEKAGQDHTEMPDVNGASVSENPLDTETSSKTIENLAANLEKTSPNHTEVPDVNGASVSENILDMDNSSKTIENLADNLEKSSHNHTEMPDVNGALVSENTLDKETSSKTIENLAETVEKRESIGTNENTLGTSDSNQMPPPQTTAVEPVENCLSRDTTTNQVCLVDFNNEQNKENVNPNVPNIFDDLENPEESDDFDTRSVMSDHSYCRAVVPRKVLEENNNITCNKNFNTASKDITVPFVSGGIRIIPRIVKIKLPKEKKVKIKVPTDELLPPKRRKLSSKQIEKLVSSLVVAPAVKEMKFEKFFSMNYQPQLGEGDIEELNYESEVSDTEENIEEPSPIETEPPHIETEPPIESQATETVPVHVPDREETHSVFSDHSYCQRSDREMHDDSGYVSVSQGQLSTVEGEHGEHIESIFDREATSMECGEMPSEIAETLPASQEASPAREVTPRDNMEPSLEGEYQRLLVSLRESRTDNRDEVPQAVSTGSQSDQQSKEQEKRESRARVAEWRDTITPILRNLKERDFNIHDYGSRIMDGMEIEETKPFSAIVDGKSSAEVVRYFIASLQLANTYNIEICGAKKGELSNDSYKVKMLKKDRYHEHLTDYQAPSEETFRERLKRVRAMRDTEPEESVEPIPKHQRFKEPLSKKRRQSRIYSPSKVRKVSGTYENDHISCSATQQNNENPELQHIQDSRICQRELQINIVDSVQSVASTSILEPCEDRSELQHTKDSTICRKEVQINIVNSVKSFASKSILKPSRPNFLKGKNIIKSPCTYGPQSSPVSPLPSTSRHVHFSENLSCSPKSSMLNRHSPIDESLSSTTFLSPSTRRESTEEVFRDHLVRLQAQNPDLRMFSTPEEERQCRSVERLSKGRSLIFE